MATNRASANAIPVVPLNTDGSEVTSSSPFPIGDYVWTGLVWVPRRATTAGIDAGVLLLTNGVGQPVLDQIAELQFRILQKLDEISDILSLSAPAQSNATFASSSLNTANVN